MNPAVRTLRNRLEPSLSALGRARWRAGAGLPPASPEEGVAPLPELSRAETFAAVWEARAAASERAAPRLRALGELVADSVEERLAAPATAEVRALEQRGQVALDERTLTLSEALFLLPRESSRGRREVLERALSHFLLEQRSPWARRVEAAAATAEALGFPSYLALRDAVAGFSHQALAAQGEALLAATQDAYRDLLGFALKRLEPTLRPLPGGHARYHDVLAAERLSWLDTLFPREDVLPALQRWLGELGLGWTAEGRIRVDLEERPGKSSRAFVARVQVPEEVHLVAWRRGGLPGWGALLHEQGHAQHFAHADADAPLEDRWLGDASVSEGWATLFEALLLDEKWLQRYVRLPHSQAREVARLAAFSQLSLLRRTAVRLAHALEVHARGPGLPLADAWAERMRAALSVECPRGLFLHEVAPQLYSARYLRGWTLEAPLTQQLRERFNEDWWRNPAAGAFLRGLFHRGARDDADVLVRGWTGAEASLAPAASRLVAVMAA